MRFAGAELSVWGAFSDLALSARPWEDPVKNGTVRGTFSLSQTNRVSLLILSWREKVHEVNVRPRRGRRGRVCRLGSVEGWRSRGAFTPQTDSPALFQNLISLKCAVFAAVIKLLLKVIVIVDYLIVNNFAVLFNRNDVGVDETAVRFQVQSLVALLYLLV